MNIDSRLKAFVQLGKIFDYLGKSKKWDGHHLGLSESEFDSLENAIYTAKIHNGWFEEQFVRLAFKNLSTMLNEDSLKAWSEHYKLTDECPNKTIAIIMAGNIPLVGFHDLLCVLITGNKAKVKMSSDDNVLLPKVLEVLYLLEPDFQSKVELVNGKLEGFYAVIATGSNNTGRYFEYYFGKYPNIIRKNRTSVAILNGDETEKELESLADDVFTYFGLGCRNVSKVYLPKGFDLDKLFKAFYKYNWVINNKKFANNYDYYRALFMMNKEPFLENGFFIMKESEENHSPLACLFYEFYEHQDVIIGRLKKTPEAFQCLCGKGFINFGIAQQPSLFDYPDGKDVVNFLQ